MVDLSLCRTNAYKFINKYIPVAYKDQFVRNLNSLNANDIELVIRHKDVYKKLLLEKPNSDCMQVLRDIKSGANKKYSAELTANAAKSYQNEFDAIAKYINSGKDYSLSDLEKIAEDNNISLQDLLCVSIKSAEGELNQQNLATYLLNKCAPEKLSKFMTTLNSNPKYNVILGDAMLRDLEGKSGSLNFLKDLTLKYYASSDKKSFEPIFAVVRNNNIALANRLTEVCKEGGANYFKYNNQYYGLPVALMHRYTNYLSEIELRNYLRPAISAFAYRPAQGSYDENNFDKEGLIEVSKHYINNSLITPLEHKEFCKEIIEAAAQVTRLNIRQELEDYANNNVKQRFNITFNRGVDPSNTSQPASNSHNQTQGAGATTPPQPNNPPSGGANKGAIDADKANKDKPKPTVRFRPYKKGKVDYSQADKSRPAKRDVVRSKFRKYRPVRWVVGIILAVALGAGASFMGAAMPVVGGLAAAGFFGTRFVSGLVAAYKGGRLSKSGEWVKSFGDMFGIGHNIGFDSKTNEDIDKITYEVKSVPKFKDGKPSFRHNQVEVTGDNPDAGKRNR